MSIEVRATPLANKIISDLPRRSRRAYDQFEADLAVRGCAALSYRLSGDQLNHLCAAHLTGTMRVIVAFESASVAYVILVGKHNDSIGRALDAGAATRRVTTQPARLVERASRT